MYSIAMDVKISYQTELLSNRLSKKYKNLRKWARKNRVSCYRLYDRDIPEIPLCIDLYELLPSDIEDKMEAFRFIALQNQKESENDQTAVKSRQSRTYLEMFLYERPYEKDGAEEELWLTEMAKAASKIIGIDENHVIIKNRRHDKGGSQYSKENREEASLQNLRISGITQEKGQLFNVNLTDYLDTGLFLDHRPLREIVRNQSKNKAVLNLFCYTASFSVFAAEGGASSVESVDLSNTYLSWAKENLSLNGFTEPEKYIFTRMDVMRFLETAKNYDLIVLDPPTFSNSKNTTNTLDINRDWQNLVNACIDLLNPEGILYFSTNSRRLIFKEEAVHSVSKNGFLVKIEEITPQTLDEDFASGKPHRVWKISTTKEREL